jgi:hypothetical protein
MKVSIPFLILGALALSGCTSLGEPSLLRPLTKLALVKVVSNDQLYDKGARPPQPRVANAPLNKGANHEKADSLVTKADEMLIEAMGSTSGSTLVSKADLFASQSYKDAGEDLLNAATFLKPDGYKYIRAKDYILAAALKKELGVNGLIAASFLFQRNLVAGTDGTESLGAITTLTVEAFDVQGKLVFSQAYIGRSKDTMDAAANLYDKGKFELLALDATRAAITMFSTDLAAR